MITLDRLVLSMHSMAISQIGRAIAGDEAPATDIPTSSQAPNHDAAPLAELAIASAASHAGQGGAQDLAGLKPPMAGLLPAAAHGPGGADITANPNTPSYLATTIGARFMAPAETSPLRNAGGSGDATGAAPRDNAPVSPEARASAIAGREIAVGVERPVTAGGDRTDFFDGGKPQGASEASFAAAMHAGAASGHAPASDALELPTRIEWGQDAGHAAAASTAEGARGGIIASFILNAGMIPGWPAPRPLAGAEISAEAMAGRLPPDPSITEEEALVYLANLGADPALIEKVRKMLQKPPPGKKILLFLATMLTALSVVVETLKHELEALAEERKEREESQDNADPRGRAGRRKRIYLE
jgi:hypothetical protein